MEVDDEEHNDEQQDPIESVSYNIVTDRTMTIRSPIWYDHEDSVAYTLVTEIGDPSTFQEALAHKDKEK